MDRVSNVRLKLAIIMLEIREVIIDEDSDNLQKFDIVSKFLLED